LESYTSSGIRFIESDNARALPELAGEFETNGKGLAVGWAPVWKIAVMKKRE
tara:strand:+ start:97 stop:252 length:156 start_codon:yes stop_codon:yes gene_type:complete